MTEHERWIIAGMPVVPLAWLVLVVFPILGHPADGHILGATLLVWPVKCWVMSQIVKRRVAPHSPTEGETR